MAENVDPFAVCKVGSKGTSLRKSLPMEVVQKLKIEAGKYIGFYEENGKVLARKVR